MKKTAFLLAMLLMFFINPGISQQPSPVKTDVGLVQGLSEDGLIVYRGIPFAAPPVGDLRWRAPQPPAKWEGVRQTASFAPGPMQNGNPPSGKSEDCLYLNVWTPAKSAGDRIPVLVWIYGGGFGAGATSEKNYSGENLAKKGVVLVSIAYRVGQLGFLAHPELSKENPNQVSGNYGLLDMIAGLQWVKKNIAAFGGDPKKVTIFGESAGGIAVSMLCASPLAKGLFHGAISQSGGNFGPPRPTTFPGENQKRLTDAERAGQIYLDSARVSSISELRKIEAGKLPSGRGIGMSWPIIDGYVIPDDQCKLYSAGRFNDTPILVGYNSDEGASFSPPRTPEAYIDGVKARYGSFAESLIKAYPAGTTTVPKTARDLARDAAFGWHTWIWARLQSQKGKSKAFYYYFDQHPDYLADSPQADRGSPHGQDVAYVFQHLNTSNPQITKTDQDISEAMATYWTNFAKQGDPSGNGVPEWPAFSDANPVVMYFNKTPHTGPVPSAESLKVLDAYFAWRRTPEGEKWASSSVIHAQNKLYPNEFPLKDVTLLDGFFKHARDLNIQVLLKYDVDRLLAPYCKEAGLPAKASFYPNWAGLDGHVGGHYLSAMAMNYAATNNAECKRRMEYMISELKTCQEAGEINNSDWGKGYIGGIPNSKGIWSTLQKGDFKAYRSAWAPWYNLHKLYAGLRDAWIYAENKDARTIFFKFCDWGINLTSSLTDAQMQTMLDSEQGGMNEIFADAYQISGDEKYLMTAKRFSHRMLLDAMSADKDNLDNKHANTQVPKAIGFQRIAELSHDKNFAEAGSFFWETVTEKRSLAFGGNSRREFFPSASSCIEFITDVEGPESCNSYNMLKLTEDLFRTDPSAKYADYYERTLFNHILSTQHPEHGGYVYFTPARPRHYRVYSAPNEAMWCCVGTGMENHGKYNQFIYTHNKDSLFLNLFIASELNWKEKSIIIKQETIFPDEEKTKLTVTRGSSHFTLMIRYPSWVKEAALKITVNGKVISYKSLPSSYIAVDRLWKAGDVVEVLLPMHNSIEYLPNVHSYVAVMHGPILLAAKTGTEDLKGLIADDSRFGQIPGGQKLPIDKAPIIIEDDISKIPGELVPVKDKPLTFTAPGLNMINPTKVVFEPFFRIHDARYMMYWMSLTNAQSKSYLDSLAVPGKEKMEPNTKINFSEIQKHNTHVVTYY